MKTKLFANLNYSVNQKHGWVLLKKKNMAKLRVHIEQIFCPRRDLESVVQMAPLQLFTIFTLLFAGQKPEILFSTSPIPQAQTRVVMPFIPNLKKNKNLLLFRSNFAFAKAVDLVSNNL